jgi:peptide methionine sulfoxide reductase msrA/msrB
MTKWRRAFGSLFMISILLIAIGALLISPLLTRKSSNPSLNKSAVGTDTPYIVLGMGCFWGAEKRMQALAGVLDVEAGYAGGDIPHPNYQSLHDIEESIHQGKIIKNHAEVVKVYYDPKQINHEQVLIQFWENHNPVQGDRQGNDIGSNYRSAVFYRTAEERQWAEKTRSIYQGNLKTAGYALPITTEIAPLKNYTSAEEHHQDYLEKNPLGYCGLGGTGVAYLDPSTPIRDKNTHATQLTAKNPGSEQNWQQIKLNTKEQLIVFEAIECGYCKQFDQEVLSTWKNPISIVSTYLTTPPNGWKLNQDLFATPTIVLFRDRLEVARYTGYQGSQQFWKWLNNETVQ